MTNVFSSFWDRRYVLKEYDTEKRLLLEGIGPHSERIMFGTDHPAGSGTLEEVYAGPNPTDVVRSFAISGRKRTGRPTASFSSGMSTIRPRIETPSLSRTTATA